MPGDGAVLERLVELPVAQPPSARVRARYVDGHHVPAAPISSFARRSLKIFDAILEALTLLLVDIAPMRPPPHSCILKMRQHSLSVLAGIDHS
jgi:hypothetical protein